MRGLKNPNLVPLYSRFSNGINGFGSFGDRGVLNTVCGIPKIVNRGGYDEMSWYKYTTFAEHLGSIYGPRPLKMQNNSVLNPNMADVRPAIGHEFGNFIRHEHSVSREWLAKRWVEEKKRKYVIRKKRRRYPQRVESKEPVIDTSFKFPFMQSFFMRSIPVEQGLKMNEAHVLPPVVQFDEELLNPQTPEEVKLSPLLARANLLITRDIEWANIMFAFEQENRYAIVDPYYAQSPVGFIREQSNVLTRQLLRTRRPFIAHITDAMGNEVFRVRRPFWWITSTIYAEVNGKEVGVVRRRWHLWRRIYDLYLENKQFAVVENPGLWNWTFTLKDEVDNTLAQIDRDWRGFGLELFTDAGQYVIRFGNTSPSLKIGLASTVQELKVTRPLTLLERAVAVALAISLDNDFFSRTGGGWGLPILVAGE
ncbi:hypothetical protein KSP40_PGU009140 [Platanthera guangdongensis]|uniref:Phospholipid scramblase n=1 Tax=Platanthera guangdongensis TaxID=2320717 RepID=A0ABR2MZQ7_9ASPA